MNEGEMISEIKSTDSVYSERLYRDRFVFPEALIMLFKTSDEIVEAIEGEIKERIKKKEINILKNNEVILKNIAGSFYNDLSKEEQESLVKVIGEIKSDILGDNKEKAPAVSLSKKEGFADDELKRMIRDSENLLREEARRAGDIAEVSREFNGNIAPEGDPNLAAGIKFD